MNFKKLGNTNLKVSTICLGTMTWGEQNNQKEAFEQMNYALDSGINFFDTAEIYPSPCYEKTYGSTEKIIGNWFKEKSNRNQVILASKVAGPGIPWVRGGGSQYCEESIEKAIENSLKRLQTDYIDLYQLHWPERKTNFFGRLGYEHKEEETVGFKGKLKFDSSKPDGPPRKLIDVTKLSNMGWNYQIELEDGLKLTYEWFLSSRKQSDETYS